MADDLGRGQCRIEALYKVSSEVYGKAHFLRCFHALRKRNYIVIVAEIYYLAHKMLFFRLIVYIAYERMVYLDIVRHIPQQIAHI